MSDDPAVQVRPMLAEDLAMVIEIAAVVPTAPHWPPQEYTRMLRVIASEPERRGAWVALSRAAPDVFQPERVVGFAMATQVAGCAELEAVVTDPAWRRRGIGAALVQAVAAWGREVGAERLVLEARASNTAAVQLYVREGFVREGLRRGYYRNPDEDALLFGLRLDVSKV